MSIFVIESFFFFFFLGVSSFRLIEMVNNFVLLVSVDINKLFLIE